MTAIRTLLAVLSAPLVALILVGTLRARDSETTSSTLRDLKVLSEVTRLASQNYVDPVDFNRLERGAYLGLVESLDPWSSYLEPSKAAAITKPAEEGELGVLLLKLPQQYVQVASLVPGSPADEAGLQRGEGLESIEGLETKDMSLIEAQGMLSGPVGSKVRLGFFRRGNEERGREVVVERRDLSGLRVVTSSPSAASAIVRVTDTRPGVTELVRAALEDVTRSGAKSLVLDLRYNLGGSAEEAARLAGLFVGQGPIAQRKSRTSTSTLASTTSKAWKGGVVVLTGRATVGEAELVAAAIQRAKAGTLVGQATFGKHVAQDLVRLSDGSALYLSVAEYLGPDGEAFSDDGVKPDEEVAPPLSASAREKASEDDEGEEAEAGDATPEATTKPAPLPGMSVPELPKTGKPDDRSSEGVLPPESDDPQLQRALELLAPPVAEKKAA